MRLLLDTHVLVRWMTEFRKLGKEQARELNLADRRNERVAISAITLWEIAQLSAGSRLTFPDQILDVVEDDPSVVVLPLTARIAREAASLRYVLRDPADCVIAATARVHGLRLLTSDQRIIESNVIATIA